MVLVRRAIVELCGRVSIRFGLGRGCWGGMGCATNVSLLVVFELNFAGDGAYAFLGPYVINSGWCPGEMVLVRRAIVELCGACRYGLGSKGCWGGMVYATNVSLLVVS